MQIGAIVDFWRGEQKPDDEGRWTHSLDRPLLDAGPHSFNLDYPVSPYVGDVLTAPVVILNANAGYGARTASEFPDAASIHAYVARVDEPAGADWTSVSRYYDDTNYGHLLASGKAVLVNACAYRSPKITKEPDNQKMIRRLPSSTFVQKWLLEAILPLARRGERLVVFNRGGQWKRLPKSITAESVIPVRPTPRSPAQHLKP